MNDLTGLLLCWQRARIIPYSFFGVSALLPRVTPFHLLKFRCKHCRQLEPEYAKAAQDLEKDGLLLGKVRCGEDPMFVMPHTARLLLAGMIFKQICVFCGENLLEDKCYNVDAVRYCLL